MKVKAFKAWRPAEGKAETVASVPYDVVDTKQAAELAAGNPDSFLHAVRAEIDLPEGTNPYSDAVYHQQSRVICIIKDSAQRLDIVAN